MSTRGVASQEAELNSAKRLAYTSVDEYVVTTPNAEFVPEPYVGLVRVYLCKDFRYGVHDPCQWPAIFTDEFDYLCAIRRRTPSEELKYPRMWDTPKESADFDLFEGSAFKSLGLLSKQWFSPLDALVDLLETEVLAFAQGTMHPHLLQLSRTMCDARHRVLHFPSTYRDACMQLRTIQRHWLMCRAYLDFAHNKARAEAGSYLPVDTSLMGAFVTQPALLQRLSRAGIPVWLIRPNVKVSDIHVEMYVMAEQPQLVCERLEDGASPIYSGLVGGALVQAVSRRANLYVDVSRAPLLVRYDSEYYRGGYSDAIEADTPPPVGPAPANSRPRGRAGLRNGTGGGDRGHTPYSRPHPSHLRGRDKFIDPVHDWMPAQLPAWEAAMKSVDRSVPAKRQGALWGYWIPEPALLLGPRTLDRTRRYLKNWLRIRPAWLYLLAHPDSHVTRVPPQWWRDYLNGDAKDGDVHDETRRAKRLQQVNSVFQVAFDLKQYAAVSDGPVRWHTYRISELPSNLCPLILWEVHEIGFRYELLALDRLLVPMRDVDHADLLREALLARVFPDNDLYYLRTLPEKSRGLSATIPEARVPCLEAFRRVLSRWPLCPETICITEPLALNTPRPRIDSVEKAMATFYVQTFFSYSGRAPIVPHALPPFRQS